MKAEDRILKIRTRIAPSPTGDPHLGTAYVALFNYVYSKNLGGSFILRIEDTDQKRSTMKSEKDILNSLRWLGLKWDEGPDVDGDFGPYRQSERLAIYREAIEILIDREKAFYCFCSPEELQKMRKDQLLRKVNPHYDGRCRFLDRHESKKRFLNGESAVVRMIVPDSGNCIFQDRIRGEISIPWSQVDMQVLLKADGFPTYHLANIVDDHHMQITDVIRGEEWISSVPKHKLLYEAFGWEMPRLCHLPLLRNPDQSKLSKRKNPTSVLYYRDSGFLPEALLNYLGRMGWSMPNESERFTLDEMIKEFDIERISLGGPVFDNKRLKWLNGVWLREGIGTQEFVDKIMEWGFSRRFFEDCAPHLKNRIETFSDAEKWLKPLLAGEPALEKEVILSNELTQPQVVSLLQFLVWRFDDSHFQLRSEVEKEIRDICTFLGLKLKHAMPLLFIILSGSKQAISIFDLIILLKPGRSRQRLQSAIEIIGGVSKKFQKSLENSYKSFCSRKFS